MDVQLGMQLWDFMALGLGLLGLLGGLGWAGAASALMRTHRNRAQEALRTVQELVETLNESGLDPDAVRDAARRRGRMLAERAVAAPGSSAGERRENDRVGLPIDPRDPAGSGDGVPTTPSHQSRP